MNGFDKDFVPIASMLCCSLCFSFYFDNEVIGLGIFFGLLSFRI